MAKKIIKKKTTSKTSKTTKKKPAKTQPSKKEDDISDLNLKVKELEKKIDELLSKV